MVQFVWTGAAFDVANKDRPAWPEALKVELFNRFVTSAWAQQTTIAMFLNSAPDAAKAGTLNLLHRRHVVSWTSILRVVQWIANRGWGIDIIAYNLVNLARHLHCFEQLQNGLDLKDQNRMIEAAARFGESARTAYLCESNLFIGPGIANSALGGGFDQGEDQVGQDLTSQEAGLLAGLPHHGLAMAYWSIKGALQIP